MRILFTLILSILSGSVLAQFETNKITLYYNTDWLITSPERSSYYWVGGFQSNSNNFNGPFSLFTNADQLITTGNYNGGAKTGRFRFFYLNGEISSEGEYRGDRKKGLWRFYNPDGSEQQKIEFTGKRFSVLSFRDSLGHEQIQNRSGSWYMELKINERDAVIRGQFERGRQHGEWVFTYANGDTILVEHYRRGKFRSGYMMEEQLEVEYSDPILTSALFDSYILERIESLDHTTYATRQDYPLLFFLPEE